MKTPKSKRPARCPLPTCSRSSLVERLAETPKTDALADEIKRNNWQDWHNLEKMEGHAKTLERSENKLKHRIRQLLKHRGQDGCGNFFRERNSGGTPEMKTESKKDVIGVASHALFSAELPYDSEPQKTQ